jgi:CRP-like cAMP-binding protein
MPVPEEVLDGNRLLAAIDGSLRGTVAEAGTLEEFDTRALFFEQGEPIARVAFPLQGVWSLLSVMDDGRSVELATVGNEGFVGLPVFLRATLTSSHRAIVQIPGRAIMFEATTFLDLSNSGGRFQTTLQRYAQALITQISQTAACNRLHTLEQRCARWLLQTHDRVDSDEFPLTQEFLGQMLGVGRQAVNEAAQSLQSAGLIRYTRGAVTVLDRAGLHNATCECYDVVRSEFERLLPPAA